MGALGSSRLLVALLAFGPAPLLAYVLVGSASNTYGYDGPWNAVTIHVGGFENGTTDSAQWTTIDAYPGGSYSTFALSTTLCSSSASTSASAHGCGAGGTWDPGSEQTEDDETVSFPGTFNDAAGRLFMDGQFYLENLNVGGSSGGQSYTTPNTSIVAVSNGSITLPNGEVTEDIEVGYFALGTSDQRQLFTIDASDAADPGIYAWIPGGYLYNTSVTKSYSYGLHLGSAAFDYPASVIIGGYDQGRTIGNGTTFGDSPPQLLDITIGVETGGSPFTFSSIDNLLIDNTSTHNQLPASPDPTTPYLSLPQQTCDKLASILPVKYNSNGYYLWDTTNASYTNITSSAAYLGFVFPPAAGDSDNVVIKVPFALLNLSLTNPASGQSGSVPYFPCQPFTPNSGDNYRLGKAFLQSAFLGRNFNQHVSWLAQAPGPGPSKAGLGFQPRDIEDDDTTLAYLSGDNLFNQSWAGHWTPLASSEAAQGSSGADSSGGSSGTNGTTSNSAGGSGGLSTGAQAGIGVGVGLAALIAIIAGILLFMRRKKRSSQAQNASTAPVTHEEKPAPQYEQVHQRDYYGGANQPPAELANKHGYGPNDQKYVPQPNQPAPPSELSSHVAPQELAGSHGWATSPNTTHA